MASDIVAIAPSSSSTLSPEPILKFVWNARVHVGSNLSKGYAVIYNMAVAILT